MDLAVKRDLDEFISSLDHGILCSHYHQLKEGSIGAEQVIREMDEREAELDRKYPLDPAIDSRCQVRYWIGKVIGDAEEIREALKSFSNENPPASYRQVEDVILGHRAARYGVTLEESMTGFW